MLSLFVLGSSETSSLKTSGSGSPEEETSGGGTTEVKTSGGSTKEVEASAGGTTEVGGTTKESVDDPGGSTTEVGGTTKESADDPGGSTTEVKASGGGTTEVEASGGGTTEESADDPGGGTTEVEASGGGTTEVEASGGGTTEESADDPGGGTTEVKASGGGTTEESADDPGGGNTEVEASGGDTTEESADDPGFSRHMMFSGRLLSSEVVRMYYTAYVGHLPIKTTKADLMELFAAYRPKEAVVLNRENSSSFSYGFVRFDNPQAVVEVIKEGDWRLHETQLTVKLSKESNGTFREVMAGKNPTSKAFERDSLVRSRVKESCRLVNKEVDVMNGEEPLDATWVLSHMESCRPKYSPKLTGTPDPSCILTPESFALLMEPGLEQIGS
ncbi:hypothetical protein ACOMHN_017792 [Nucella lapillus]